MNQARLTILLEELLKRLAEARAKNDQAEVTAIEEALKGLNPALHHLA